MNSIVTTGTNQITGMPQAASDDQLVAMWLSKSDSDATKKAYRRAINRLRAWLNSRGSIQLARTNAVDFLEYLETFKDNWSDATCNQHKAAIKSLWTYGCELQYFAFNVPHAVYKLKKPRPVTAERILTEDEMSDVFTAEPNPKAKLFLRFLFGTGVRVSEALAVQWRDFHRRGDRVFLMIEHGKGDKFREIGCPLKIYQAIANSRPPADSDEARVFKISYPTAWYWTRRALKRIDKVGSPHWLRHAHAVVSHENGAEWHAIARQLGHNKPSFTMDRYGHFSGKHSSDFIDC